MSLYLSDPEDLRESLPEESDDDDLWWGGSVEEYEYTDR